MLLGLSTGKLLYDYNRQILKIYEIKGKKSKLFQKIKLKGKLNCIKEFYDKSLYLSIDDETGGTKIVIYILNKDDTYSLDSEIGEKYMFFAGIIQLNNDQFVVSCRDRNEDSEFLSYYNIEQKESYAITKGVPECWWGFKLDDDYICFYQTKGIYLINLRNHELVFRFQLGSAKDGSMSDIWTTCRLTDNMMLINDNDGNIIQLKVDREKIYEYSRTPKVYHRHKGDDIEVKRICLLNNGQIATFASEYGFCQAKVW